MKFGYVILFFLFLSSYAAKGQPPEIIYPATVVYEGYYDDRSWGPLNIGFNFTFYGNTYNRFYVTSNGLIMFGSGSNDYTEDPIPFASSPNNLIAAFWDDIVINSSGKILYTTIGASPNRKCIIQWTNMGFYASNVLMGTFSVILYEGSNNILIQYRSIIDNTSARSHGSSASIGIENSTGTSGIQYAYHNSTAILSEQAILFHPSGSIYTMNPSAVYDGVYLTKNINLPEPGIPKLVNPANNGIIGSSQTFEWSSSSNVSYYTLKISRNSDISGSFDYNTGTNTSYEISDLALNTTYYWAVFATNSTGTTWSEIYRFTTSANPPLSAVPQTIWTDQGEESVIRLQHNGGDESMKTAQIITLPSQGSLYQYNNGTKGSPITTVPSTVTDPDLNLIYFADGAAGNGAGNFRFFIHDNTGDSPAGTITINVSPPGIPNFLLAAKSGNIEIQFDKPMADPTGKEDQFIVTLNGIPVAISAVSLKPGDPYSIIVTLDTPLTGSETVLISYTQGDVTSESGGLLPSFVDQPVNFIIQTVSFTALHAMMFGDPPITLIASASSGLPVTFTSSNSTVATINGNILNANSTGSADITAMQSGDGTYAPARYIRTLTVSQTDQTISFPAPGAKTYGDNDFDLEATASSGLIVSYASDNPAVATVSGATVHITGAGTAIITASQPGNDIYYSAIDATVTLIVNKADQTITFDALVPMTFGDPDFNIPASASSSLNITFTSENTSVAIVTGGLIHIVNAGTVSIKATQPGNQNYNAAPDVTQTLTINKADQVITFPSIAPVVYGVASFNVGASSTSGLTVTYNSDNTSVAEIINGKIYIRSAGSSNITASQAGDNNFNPAENKIVAITVTRAHLTITAENKLRPYLSANPVLTLTFSGFVYGETVAVLDTPPVASTTASADSPAGDYVITISEGIDNCYDITYVTGILTITMISQTITFISYPDKLLVTETFELVAVTTSGLTVSFESNDPEIARVTGSTLTGISRGNADIRAWQQGNENYYPAENEVTVEVVSTHENIMYLFSPNNDGFNDYWEIPGLGEYGKCEVRVYSRSGKLVFSSTEYQNEWDGTSNGVNLPSAAYYFIIKTENAGTITGTVNIVR
jgi:gliding motility-associated-like protein